ncbi:unnamed protein product [Anisakis simplex]|uniref:Uncharacterized protein n=1 Tax=Anisakis simplex TaxID=6269 RepID=A0A0M3JME1_ANISI|nr:unnamed protein product [Anisakis simplex]
MDANNVTTTTLIPPAPIHPMHGALKAILILTLFVATFLACMVCLHVYYHFL